MIIVTMDVQAVPELYIGQDSLDFGSDDTEGTFTISNRGEGSLIWEIDIVYEDGNGWIEVDPAEGDAGSGQSETVTVSVSRQGLEPGDYEATIQVDTENSSAYVTVTMMVSDEPDGDPVLGIDRRLFFFRGSTKRLARSESEVIISNEGTGVLEWKTGEIKYRRVQEWIRVEPSSGMTGEAEEEAVRIVVDREGLKPGIYGAVLPIESNGGNKNIVVLMMVPLFNNR